MKNFTLDFEKPLRELEVQINDLEKLSQSGKAGLEKEIEKLRRKIDKLRRDTYTNLNRWITSS